MRNQLSRKEKPQENDPTFLKKSTIITLLVVALIALAFGLWYSTSKEDGYTPKNWSTSPRGLP